MTTEVKNGYFSVFFVGNSRMVTVWMRRSDAFELRSREQQLLGRFDDDRELEQRDVGLRTVVRF